MGVPTIYETHAPIEDDGIVGRILFSLLVRAPSFKYLVVITNALQRHFEEAWPALRGRVVVAPDGADALLNGVGPVIPPFITEAISRAHWAAIAIFCLGVRAPS